LGNLENFEVLSIHYVAIEKSKTSGRVKKQIIKQLKGKFEVIVILMI